MIEDININKTKILENFAYIENIANVHIIVCYKSLFTKNGIINNIGSFIIILIVIFHIISLFIFFIKQLPIIKSKIKGIIFGIRHSKLIKEDKKVNDEQDKKSNKEIIIEKENNNIDNNNKIRNFKKPKKKRKKRRMKKDINIDDDNQIKNNNIVNIINDNKINIPNINNLPEKSINKNNIVKSKSNKQKTIEKVKNIMEYNDDEINKLPYELAIQYDKRSYFVYYISLLKTNHNLIFSFFYNKDYNSRIIKVDLFFIGFTIYYTVNALFYNDDTIHKIYEVKGAFDLEYQLPKIIYSSFISMLLNTILKILSLSNSAILDFKNNKAKKGLKERTKSLKNKLHIKFILFFIISFILFDFFLVLYFYLWSCL